MYAKVYSCNPQLILIVTINRHISAISWCDLGGVLMRFLHQCVISHTLTDSKYVILQTLIPLNQLSVYRNNDIYKP